MAKDYSYFEHRHKFAAWAAARAVQRGWAGIKTADIVDAVEHAGLLEFLQKPESWPQDAGSFDSLHRHWCCRLAECLRPLNAEATTFGRLAKVVAVYLKSMVVVGPDWASRLARIIHPPIDRLVLGGIASDSNLNARIRSACRNCNWTELNENGYYELINELRASGMDQPAFWMLERYWVLSGAD